MIYLASTSPRRKKILQKLRLRFRVISPSYEEKNETKKPPSVLVRKHALAKAVSCVSKVRDGIILGADTLVYCGNSIIGKPKNMKDAFKILNHLQGGWHTVYTGVALLNIKHSRMIKKMVFSEKTRVRLRVMNRMAIESYFKKINPLDKAGAYAIQSDKANIIEEVRGSLTNAIGLPVERLAGRESLLES